LRVETKKSTLYSTFLKTLLSAEHHVYLLGAAGAGKSALVARTLDTTAQIDWTGITYSDQTRIGHVQDSIESKLYKIKKTLLGSRPNRKFACFIDDIHMARAESLGGA